MTDDIKKKKPDDGEGGHEPPLFNRENLDREFQRVAAYRRARNLPWPYSSVDDWIAERRALSATTHQRVRGHDVGHEP